MVEVLADLYWRLHKVSQVGFDQLHIVHARRLELFDATRCVDHKRNVQNAVTCHNGISSAKLTKGGATVLKVGGQILQAKRAEIVLPPAHFLASGGQNIA